MASRLTRITGQNKQRIRYSDFTSNLDLNPITGELEVLTNDQSVINAIKNLVLTYPTERPYQPLLGSTVTRNLFDFVDGFTQDQIKNSIIQTITNYEPRVQNLNVTVTAFPQQNYVSVDITFQLANFPGKSFTVPSLLLRLR